MDSSKLLGITTFLYLFSSALYLAILIFRVKKIGIVATVLTIIGLLTHTAGIGMRWLESYQMGIGHAPLSNMYESLVFFAWSIILMYVVVEFIYKNKVIGAFAVPFAFASMAYASLSTEFSSRITPLAFAVACGTGIMYLVKSLDKGESSDTILGSLPSLKVIDDITHKIILFGFLWLSAGIISGAVWANSAWGTYWSWDPKETWSLITWFIYASALHARFTRGWGGKRIAWIAILGFLAVIFTYYGVNFLLSGLHSYG
jgi:ABC-type transport system involved in cytochrome c biogenesis permease subunit